LGAICLRPPSWAAGPRPRLELPMSGLRMPASAPEPPAFCSTRLPGRNVRLRLSQLRVPEVVLVLAVLAANNRSVPAALVVAGAVADLITGRSPGAGTAQRCRRGRWPWAAPPSASTRAPDPGCGSLAEPRSCLSRPPGGVRAGADHPPSAVSVASERRRQRALTALDQAIRDGADISVSGLARAAGVDRTYFYRHRDLLERIHAAAAAPSPHDGHAAVSRASLQADRANAHERNSRLTRRVR
jgi:hypothetical protein